MSKHPRLVAALTALTLVVACAESPTAPASGALPSLATTSAATIAVATCQGGSTMLTPDEKRTLELHNAQRAALGLSAFCVDADLTAAARSHSTEMLARGYFAHGSNDGTTFDARLTGFGYAPFTALAENIAWGSGPIGDPAAIFTSWMNSVGHRQNIANASLREIGIGVSGGSFQGFAGARMYTVDFGTR